MKIKTITAVYFSPTGGTKKYVRAIAKALSAEYRVIDLTIPQVRSKEYVFGEEDLLILGAPVYAGRLPEIPGGIFEKIRGDKTPAVFTVSYGNREFEDALLEEKKICEANGFVGIGAAAWIAPHTYSDRIAAGRPDAEDMKKVKAFAEEIKARLQGKLPQAGELLVPGNHPYRDRKKPGYHPKGNENCTGCGTCVAVCPTGAIFTDHPEETDAAKCINCFACVKVCPSKAREVTDPAHEALASRLEANLISVRKEPQTFFPAAK